VPQVYLSSVLTPTETAESLFVFLFFWEYDLAFPTAVCLLTATNIV